MHNYHYEDGLETERLLTRKLVYDDYKTWSAFFDEPDAIQFFTFLKPTSSEERAKDWIEKQLARYQEQRYGLQALIDKKTGEMIGQCGLLAQDIDGKIELEVGYSLFKKHWGKGYATEAAIRFKEFGFAHNQAESIISIIDVHNIGSQKVALKNGMIRGKQLLWHDMNVYIFRVFK
ncbi:MAG: GNAT family N-acetyltransferase [Saprospirales bacterium]|nr:GNAT family N-acetyltransferase [Saprospirales bacterium]MBK8492629.1 GNAT family N-acetyltransferase [Saprospirales bacterium]